jgi:hypothetical protein
MILKFKTVLAIQYISFLKSFWDRFQSKMYWNEEHFAYNVIIISIICYNYLLVYIVSSTYRDHFRNLPTAPKVCFCFFELPIEWSYATLRFNKDT